ncbi:MAG: hypothetical protein HKN70_14460 [Gammaproteobacteria bacterium]|nr:hypothetical protein [Gammaproteobacteria bacterium]
MKYKTTSTVSVRFCVAALFTMLFGIAPLSSAVAAEIYGMPAARVEQSRGVDKSVDYQSLTKMGLWDDRNYSLTADDLTYLSKNETELSAKIPAFFRVELRKAWPHLQKTGPVQYPRAAWQYFRHKYGGVKRNGKIWGPDPKANRVPVPVNGELQLNAVLGANEITVEINPSNPDRVIAGSNNNGGQEMYYSANGGDTWTIQGVLPSTCCDPTVGWSSDGSVAYVAALSSPIGVSFWRSLDQGVTWQDRVDITPSGSDKEFLHVDISPTSPHQDNIYITYHNGNTMQIARSTNGGTTFTIQAFGGAPSGIGSDITTTSNGDVYNFYGAFGTQQIILLKSTDGGNTYGTPIVVDSTNASFDWPIPSMESRNAWIYVAADADRSGGPFDGRVYASWTDTNGPESGIAANNHTQVKVAYSDDGGATWNFSFPHPTADVLTVDRFNQWLTVDEVGNVHVVYYDTRNSTGRTGVDLYYTISTDGGVTWNEPERVSSATSANLTDGQEWGDYNGVSVVGGKVITVWTDNREGPPNEKDVYAADLDNIGAAPNFTLSGDTASAEVCVPDSFDTNLTVGQILGFSDPVTLSNPGAPAGFVVNYSANPVNPPGTSVATVTVGGTVASGNYSFDIVGSAAGVDDRALTLNVSAADAAPGVPTLTSPADGATDQAIMPTFNWDSILGATSYDITIATDPDFTSIVETGSTGTTSYTSAVALSPETSYYWRVSGNNACGDGADSTVNSFTTGAIICTAPGLGIVDNVTVSDSLPLADTGVIDSLAVTVDASHTWVGDVTLTLVHEDTGTSVELMNRPGTTGTGFGCQENDIAAEFNDTSSVIVENECSTTPPAIGGIVNPQGTLGDFAGESIGGTWRLDVSDSAGGDTGTLNEWCLLPALVVTDPDSDGDGVTDSVDNCTDVANADQRDSNGDGFGNVCDFDYDNNCVVQFTDIQQLGLSIFTTDGGGPGPNGGLYDPDFDLNDDGAINFGDLGAPPNNFAAAFLEPPGPSANACVPAP